MLFIYNFILFLQARVMVSLTSLLLLSSLFAETSKRIPDTNYFKFIESWYIVLILQVFFIIIVVVVIEGLERESSQIIYVKSTSSKKKYFSSTSHKINFASIFIFPLVMFITLYKFISTAVNNYWTIIWLNLIEIFRF